MQLRVFADLAIEGVVTEVIISKDPLDDKLRTVVDVVTVFDKTIRLTTRQKSPRYFRDCVQALETLSSYTGENRNVKVKVIE